MKLQACRTFTGGHNGRVKPFVHAAKLDLNASATDTIEILANGDATKRDIDGAAGYWSVLRENFS